MYAVIGKVGRRFALMSDKNKIMIYDQGTHKGEPRGFKDNENEMETHYFKT